MSKAQQQSLTMLSVIAACFRQLNSTKYFARIDIRELCRDNWMRSLDTVTEWPTESNNDEEDIFQATVNLVKWESYLQGRSDNLSAASLVFVIGMLKEDLRSVLRKPNKLKRLEYLDEPLQVLNNFTDPTGLNFVACDQGKELLEELYGIMGW